MRFTRLFLMLLVCSVLTVPARGIAATAVSSCPSGSIAGNPPINQVPTYDYGDDGLVRFHFRFSQPEWNYNTLKVGLYSEDCVLETEPARGQVGGAYLPPARNLLVKVADSEPGKYNFKVYDEDTGEFQGVGLGFVPNDFNAPKIGLTLTNITGSYNAPIVDTVSTPVVPLRQTTQIPQRQPVLIIPGVMGTELFENQNLLWPNISKMFTDVGDDFLDSLAFNPDLSPANSSITVGDLVKEPFYGEHYYDSLIEGLKASGYTENQDLFVFPYDWRYGVSENIIEDLAARIEALAGNGKIDVIGHSAGGLLLKKVVQETGSAHIDKAIMVGVPNYGAAKAAKVLLHGDNFGIPWLDRDEIQKIAQNMPVMYDLLPSARYTQAYNSYFNQLDFETAASHLINDYHLNALAFNAAKNLHTEDFDNLDLSESGVNVFTLAGCGTPTLRALAEINQPFQRVVVSGDGTVPLLSALGNNPANSVYYLLKPDHGKLPGQPASVEVINGILGNTIPETFSSGLITRDQNKCGLKGKLVSIFGQVSMRIKSVAGEIIYPQSENFIDASEIQVIEQPSYTLIYFSEQELENIVEIRSLSLAGSVSIQVEDASGDENSSAPPTTFSNIPLGADTVLTISGLGIEPTLNIELPEIQPPLITPTPPVPDNNPIDDTVFQPPSTSGSSGSSSRPRVLGRTAGPINGTVLPHPEGSLINFGRTIYLIEYSQRRGLRSWGEFISHGFSAVQVQEGNTADWNLPEGLIMLAKPGILARDLAGPRKVYYLNGILEKQWISSETVLANWLNQLNIVFDIDLTGYREGLDI